MKSFLLLATLSLLAGCASAPPYVYQYIPGRTATLEYGMAIAPSEAPPVVRQAIAAGNRIAGMPYVYGGGHGYGMDAGYDCSGSASFVLRGAGLLDSSMPSGSFRHYGEPGPGEWITIWARRGHVFMSVAGLRFDTGWTRGSHGPQWTTESRPAEDCVQRHPDGL